MSRNDKDFVETVHDEITEKAEKGRRGVIKIFFGRTMITLLLVLLQFLLLLFVGLVLWQYVFYAVVAYMLIGISIVLVIVNRPGLPEIKLPWVVMTLVFPVFGGLLYLFVEIQPGTRIMNRYILAQQKRTKEYMPENRETFEQLKEQDSHMASAVGYLRRLGFSVYHNNGLEYYPLGDDWIPALLEELKKARKFIFLEYFIIEYGKVWDDVLEILMEKAAEGVEVRLMYDGTNQFSSLPYGYEKKMEAVGIRCKVFSPIRPALSTYQNNRDHRKILVIDGEVAFTGGTNLADEYANLKTRFGHWKDTAIMVRGDAVRSFTVMFLQLWDLNGYENNYEDYLDIYPNKTEELYPGYVIPYCDSPLDDEKVGKFVYMTILERAQSYVHIMTPYLILDHDMITALKFSAKRGVDIRIIMPHIPDKTYAFALARGHYAELLEAGIKIYEYLPGFVHAKVFVSDDTTAVVGTVNLDYRSLYLHFENGVLLYGTDLTEKIEQDFKETLESCIAVTTDYVKKQSFRLKLLGVILKLFAPLM